MDTFTSILAGIITFAILGNLKYELGAESIDDVVQGKLLRRNFMYAINNGFLQVEQALHLSRTQMLLLKWTGYHNC